MTCSHPHRVKVIDRLGEMRDDPIAPGGASAPVLAWHYQCSECHEVVSEHHADTNQIVELARVVVTQVRKVQEAFVPLPDLELVHALMNTLGCQISTTRYFGEGWQCVLHGEATATRLCNLAVTAARVAEQHYTKKDRYG